MSITGIDTVPPPELRTELASFLARFVREGNLPRPLPGDDQEAVWDRRLVWWWDENPFVKPGLPLAFVLRNERGRVVGFHGFIPHDYEAAGTPVPTLIATTFFIEEAYRAHSMKVFLKLNRLGREYQILDGTPSPDMRAILDRFDYERRTELKRFNILVKREGAPGIRSGLLYLGGFGNKISPIDPGPGLRISTDPEEIRAVPPLPWNGDGEIRRCVTAAGLKWMHRAGHGERNFFGLLDEGGILRAFAIGLLKTSRGITACRLLEYGSFDEHDENLIALISQIANRPGACGLPDSVSLLLWSVFEGTLKTLPDFEPEVRQSSLYYKLPSQWQGSPKTCLPCEGDLVLL